MTVKSGEGVTRHILVVEDDAKTAEMLINYFSALKYQVSHAAWGQDALDLAIENPPDLVILDIHLPDIDGYEVCSRLRAHRRTSNTPIIFLTERRERVDRLTGLELGAVDYITKPFDVQELRYRIRNIFRRSSRESMLHPITMLPTQQLVEEQIERVAEDKNLALIGIRIHRMEAFGDAYGFVAHDDVLRAVVLILQNTATEVVQRDPFVGQLDAYDFIMLVPATQGFVTIGRLHQRLNEAISFFYPHRDWESGVLSDGSPLPRIEFELALLTSAQLPPLEEGEMIAKVRQALFK